MSAFEKYIQEQVDIYIDVRNEPHNDQRHEQLSTKPKMPDMHDNPVHQINKGVREEISTYKVYPDIFRGIKDDDKGEWVKEGRIVSRKPLFDLLFWPKEDFESEDDE
jgi:hypothetical protein